MPGELVEASDLDLPHHEAHNKALGRAEAAGLQPSQELFSRILKEYNAHKAKRATKVASAKELLAGVLLLNQVKTADDIPPELLAGGIGALGGAAVGALNAQPDHEGKINHWKSALLSALLSGGMSAGLTHLMNRR